MLAGAVEVASNSSIVCSGASLTAPLTNQRILIKILKAVQFPISADARLRNPRHHAPLDFGEDGEITLRSHPAISKRDEDWQVSNAEAKLADLVALEPSS
jgi:hypothetical protein